MRATYQTGLSIIELMIGVVILGFTLMTAVPSFSDWMRDAQIRSTAESVHSGLQFARTEAVKRNAAVRFQLTDTLTSACALSTAGTNWLVNLSSSTTPAGQCNVAPSDTVTPFVLQSSPAGSNGSRVAVTASQAVVSFNGLGQQTASTTPATPVAQVTIDVAPTQGTCLADGGTARCLRVVVSPSGQSRVCDPHVTDAATRNGMRC